MPKPATPISDDAIQNLWPVFAEMIRLRLVKGCETYGDPSFTTPIEAVLAEIDQEMADIVGWSFINWCKMQKIREKVAVLVSEIQKLEPK